MAYHVVVNALEAASGWTPRSRFAASVAYAINGNLPYPRYRRAGDERMSARTGEGAIVRWVRDWIATDLNPVIQTCRSTSDIRKAVIPSRSVPQAACGR
jgi:hypothetical protein